MIFFIRFILILKRCSPKNIGVKKYSNSLVYFNIFEVFEREEEISSFEKVRGHEGL
jgi:hypothetical protein